MIRRTQGGQAASNGRFAENIIDSTLRLKGYQPDRQRVVGIGIFDTPIHADFYLAQAPNFQAGLIIESKWQETQGTADEKLCYLVNNIRYCFPCPVIIIAGGQGARTGAIQWLRAQADGIHIYAVYNLEEFVSWCNRTL